MAIGIFHAGVYVMVKVYDTNNPFHRIENESESEHKYYACHEYGTDYQLTHQLHNTY